MGEWLDRRGSRRDFLRLAAGAAAVAASGAACNSGSTESSSERSGGSDKAGTAKQGRTLRIAQWGHFVPAYDAWFDNDYTKRWGEDHGVNVVVDHLPFAQLRNRADAEVAAQRGHDIFGFLTPAPAYEDEVVDHREIVEEVEAKVGKMTPLMEASVLNPKTSKYFGIPDFWVANPALAAGHPVGFAVSPDVDANWSLESLMLAFGASIQDEDGNVVLNRPATVEAVKAVTDIYRTVMPEDVLTWDAASNNRFMASGQGSMTLNTITATRAVEKQDPDLARHLALVPALAGPSSRLAVSVQNSTYVIWRFARNPEAAKQFLVDLALQSREGFLHREYVNFPAFPGAVKDIGALLASDPNAIPAGKYALLSEADAWSTNTGHPGTVNAAIDEVFNLYLIPKMFAAAARGEMSAEDAVRAAKAQMLPIFDKWRQKGKL